MPIQFAPCGCCNSECVQITEDYERPDSTTVGGGATEGFRDWSIVSGVVQVNGTNANLVYNSWFKTGSGQSGAEVMAKAASSGDMLRLGISNIDSTGQARVELVVGASATIKMTSFNGVSTYTETYPVTAAAGTFHKLKLVIGPNWRRCWLNDVLVLSSSGAGGVASRVSVTLGTGGTSTGIAEFNDLKGLAYGSANEQQSISANATGGGFDLEVSVDGNVIGTTVPIAYNASAATIQSALETVLGSGNVTVTGGPINGGVAFVNFIGAYASTPIDLMVPINSTLTGGLAIVTIAETRQGQDCPPVAPVCIFGPLDLSATDQLKLVLGGLSGSESGFNGTYFLDPTSDECGNLYADPATSHPDCACFQITGLSIFYPFSGTTVTRAFAYVANNGLTGGSAAYVRRIRIGFIDSGGVVRWRMDSTEISPVPTTEVEYGPDEQLENWSNINPPFSSTPTTATLEPA